MPTSLDLKLDGDGAWPDLAERGYAHGTLVGLTLLRDGTVTGKPTVAFRVELPDGGVVIAQTTLRLLDVAVRGIHAFLEGEAERGR